MLASRCHGEDVAGAIGARLVRHREGDLAVEHQRLHVEGMIVRLVMRPWRYALGLDLLVTVGAQRTLEFGFVHGVRSSATVRPPRPRARRGGRRLGPGCG